MLLVRDLRSNSAPDLRSSVRENSVDRAVADLPGLIQKDLRSWPVERGQGSETVTDLGCWCLGWDWSIILLGLGVLCNLVISATCVRYLRRDVSVPRAGKVLAQISVWTTYWCVIRC